MNGCNEIQGRFSEYLDGRLTGLEMQAVSGHLQSCLACAGEWASLRSTQAALASLGPVPEPEDLALRVRVAVSHERAKRSRGILENWELAWQNTVGPFLLQAGAGFASAVLLIGSVVLMIGLVATPQAAQAGDEPLGAATAPRLIGSVMGTGDNDVATLSAPVVVEAYINDTGQVYDFSIVSGPNDAATKSEIANLLLSDQFEPAKFWGQPVRGIAVLSFSGVSVKG